MAKQTIKKSIGTPKDKKDVMELVKQHDVKFIRLWFSDIHGQLKSFAVPVEELNLPLMKEWVLTVHPSRALQELTRVT